MNLSPKNRPFFPAWITVFLGLLVTGSAMLFSPRVATAVADPAVSTVQKAWEKAQKSDTYIFDSHIE